MRSDGALRCDELVVSRGIVGNGEFKDPAEELPSAAGVPTVEAEDELVQVGLQVRLLDRSVVGAEQPALGKGRDPVHSRQQPVRIATGEPDGTLAASLAHVAESLNPRVPLPAIGDHRRPGLDVAGDQRVC